MTEEELKEFWDLTNSVDKDFYSVYRTLLLDWSRLQKNIDRSRQQKKKRIEKERKKDYLI